MESMGIPNSPSGLELTIAIPASRNGVHISSSGSDGNKGFNIENMRELALLDTFNPEEVDGHLTGSMEIEGREDRQPVGGSSIQQRKYNRLSQEQSDLLEASFHKNHFPDKGTRQALADTLKVTLKKVRVWFVNRRSRFKKHKLEQNKELNSYKRQVESLASETHHLRCKLKKLKKKFNNLKLKQAPSMAPPPPVTSEEEQQQQKQVIYVPILAGLFNNGEQNVATTAVTTASFITQQGSVSATASLPVTNALLLPPSGGSSI